jgi:mannitol-1-phosphate 5-dehydrogenase
MKAVIFGAGAIGCGFAGQLLRASGYTLVFVCRTAEQAGYLNSHGGYRVCLVDRQKRQEIWVDGVSAVHAANIDAVADEIADAGLVVTAVGASNLSAIAPLIAAGLQRRRTIVNVLALENLKDAGKFLRNEVSLHLPANFPLIRFGFSGAVVSRVVTKRQGGLGADQPLTFIGDPPERFVVDGRQLRHPYPAIRGIEIVNNYRAHELCKFYMFSTGHAVAAYLGYVKGYRYLHAAIRDPEIREATLAAMRESQSGLIARYGREVAGDEETLHQIVARFDNAALDDVITRVGRDPRRKLSVNDRLVGAARLAQSAGVQPRALALGTAAALCFSAPNDPSAGWIQQQLAQHGIDSSLRQVCGLNVRRGFGRYVTEQWRRLTQGQQPGNLLLSLEQVIWA